ncbi:hypothetical protein ACXM1Q_004760 [Streptococcus sp. 10F2]
MKKIKKSVDKAKGFGKIEYMRKAEVRASRLATNVVWLYDSSPI